MNFNSNNSNKNEFSQNMELNKADSTIKNSASITKKNTFEYDNVFSKEISFNSTEMKNKYESDIKTTPIDGNNDNNDNHEINTFKETSITNTLEGSYNKNNYSSKKSMNEYIPKVPSKSYNSFISIDNSIKLKSSKNLFFVSKKSKYPKNSKLITNYKKWNGDNYFPFWASAIEGPCSFRPTLMTACAMTIPLILFYIFNSKYLTDEYSIFIPIVLGVLYLISFIYLFVASFVDPGIIRRFNLSKDDKKKDYIKKSTDSIINRNDSRIFQLGYITKYKYCPSCGIIRPIRSTHCSDCNNCVERLDHHCPWIGNCAGKRNYIYFYIFLVFLNFLTILMIIFCIIHIVSKVNDFSNLNNYLPEDKKIKHLTALSFCEVIISLYLIIYNIISMCFITGLLFYHCRLILVNSTTKEELRNIFDNNYGNPYKRSTSKNIKNVLCPKKKKYSILDILSENVKEICDLTFDKDNNNPPYDNKKTNDNDEEERETKTKINLRNSIIQELNKQEIHTPKNYRNNNINNYYNEEYEKIPKNSDFSGESNFMNQVHDNNENTKTNNSFQIIDGNIERYLKTFGIGNNFPNDPNSEYISKNIV